MYFITSRKKLWGLLTANEAEVLGPLHRNRDAARPVHKGLQPGWNRCRDLGGTRDSHHSLTLRRLAIKGLVEALRVPSERPLEKAKLAYRITPAGVALWAEYVDYREHARVAHPKINRTLGEYAV